MKFVNVNIVIYKFILIFSREGQFLSLCIELGSYVLGTRVYQLTVTYLHLIYMVTTLISYDSQGVSWTHLNSQYKKLLRY